MVNISEKLRISLSVSDFYRSFTEKVNSPQKIFTSSNFLFLTKYADITIAMISKKYRLTENEVKKVLAKRKPFFSHMIVANVFPNKLGHARIGIVLSAKQTKGSVNRNTFRRMIYDLCRDSLVRSSYDIVFVCKKGIVLDSKNETSKGNVERDVLYILKNIEKSGRL